MVEIEQTKEIHKRLNKCFALIRKRIKEIKKEEHNIEQHKKEHKITLNSKEDINKHIKEQSNTLFNDIIHCKRVLGENKRVSK